MHSLVHIQNNKILLHKCLFLQKLVPGGLTVQDAFQAIVPTSTVITVFVLRDLTVQKNIVLAVSRFAFQITFMLAKKVSQQ